MVAINLAFSHEYWVSIIIPIDGLIFFRGVGILAHQPDEELEWIFFQEVHGGENLWRCHEIRMNHPDEQHQVVDDS